MCEYGLLGSSGEYVGSCVELSQCMCVRVCMSVIAEAECLGYEKQSCSFLVA